MKTWKPGDGLEAAMELLDGPAEYAVDLVPTVDQAEPLATYQDWRKEDTRVITCRIANDIFPGKRFESRAAAVAWVTANHGRIVEANYTPGRAFFRVLK